MQVAMVAIHIVASEGQGEIGFCRLSIDSLCMRLPTAQLHSKFGDL